MADYISQFTGSEIDQRLAKVPQLETAVAGKQATLVSGTNIKTINGQPVLGSGDMQIQSGDTNAVKYVAQTLTDEQKAQARANIDAASLEDIADMDFVTAATLPTASASTMGHIYLIGPDANNNYDRYFTQEDGSSYSWVSLGSTQIDLSTYATKEEVTQLEAKVDGLAEVNIDPASVSSADCYINSQNQWMVGNANSHGKIVAVLPGRTITIKANATNQSIIALVKGTTPVNGASVDYATGESKHIISSGDELTLTIPSDAVYLWFSTANYANDLTPQSIKIVGQTGLSTRMDDAEEEIEELNEEVGLLNGEPIVKTFPVTHGSNTFEYFSLKANTQYKFVLSLDSALGSDSSFSIRQGNTVLYSDTIQSGESGTTAILPANGVLPSDLDNVYMTLYDASYTNKVATLTLSVLTSPTDKKLGDKVGFVKSVNLFDKTNPAIISGKYITTTGFASASGYRISHPIPVTPGVTYKFPKGSGLGTNNNVAVVDASNNFVTYKAGTVSGDYIEVTAPEASQYIAINLGNQAGFLDTCMFCKSSDYPGTYTPYYTMVDPQYSLDASKLIGQIPESSASNPLKGKIISFNGDSICYGAGYAGGYGKIIADRNEMVYENRGVAGGTIEAESYYYVAWENGGTTYYTRMLRPIPGTDKAYTNTAQTEGETAIDAYSQQNGTITIGGVVYTFSSADSSAKHWICRDVLNMRSDADYVILEGGVNNGGAVPDHGTVSSGYAKSTIDALDDYIFAPAFERMLVNAFTRFPGKKIGYIFVHKMTTYYSSNGNTETNRYYLAKKCCEKWGVPFLDLNTEVPAFGLFPADGDAGLAYLRSQYTNGGDGWHPNEAGYKKYYCDKIEAWLKTL